MRNVASTKETVVNFPISKGDRTEASEHEEHARLRPSAGDQQVNILIVDDEPKNLTVLETVLNDPAYRLIKAESADQALLALLVDQFALLILDIRMPGVTGIELAHMIKKRKKTSQIPIIFLTAFYNEDQHVLEGYGAGAVDYLHKPVNPDILRSKVAVFVELYRMQQEIKVSNQALLEEVTERRETQNQLRELNNTLEQRVMERTSALRASAALLQAATDNASVGLATLDRDFRYTFANPAYGKIFATPPDIADRRLEQLLEPADVERVAPHLRRALSGERNSSELSHPTNGQDGLKYYSVICEPERDGDGQISGAVMIVMDVTDRKRSEEHIRLLLREVNHRSRNMLSIVCAIARQTKASNQEEFVDRFSDRVQALAAAHDLLVKSEWQSIDVSELLRSQLAHFGELFGRRILFNGPPLQLSPAGAQCIGMVSHELATNAAKHGALSNTDGRVEITWAIENSSTDECFMISWVEHGGPAVVASSSPGYGSTVIKSMAELTLDGEVQLAFEPTGLSWRMRCPVPRILYGGRAEWINESTVLPTDYK